MILRPEFVIGFSTIAEQITQCVICDDELPKTNLESKLRITCVRCIGGVENINEEIIVE